MLLVFEFDVLWFVGYARFPEIYKHFSCTTKNSTQFEVCEKAISEKKVFATDFFSKMFSALFSLTCYVAVGHWRLFSFSIRK